MEDPVTLIVHLCELRGRSLRPLRLKSFSRYADSQLGDIVSQRSLRFKILKPLFAMLGIKSLLHSSHLRFHNGMDEH